MIKEELNKTCNRCNALFVCNADDIAHCQCQQVSLTDSDRHFISTQFNDCLCLNCLVEINQSYK